MTIKLNAILESYRLIVNIQLLKNQSIHTKHFVTNILILMKRQKYQQENKLI